MVSFGRALELFYIKTFDYKTRSTRAEYWWATLFVAGVTFVAQLLSIPLPGLAGLVFTNVVGLVLLVPQVSLLVRRFHDIGHSGKWVIIGGVLALLFAAYVVYAFSVVYAAVGAQVASAGSYMDAAYLLAPALMPHVVPLFVFSLTILGVSVWYFVWSLLPSRPGVNKWDIPRESVSAA